MASTAVKLLDVSHLKMDQNGGCRKFLFHHIPWLTLAQGIQGYLVLPQISSLVSFHWGPYGPLVGPKCLRSWNGLWIWSAKIIRLLAGQHTKKTMKRGLSGHTSTGGMLRLSMVLWKYAAIKHLWAWVKTMQSLGEPQNDCKWNPHIWYNGVWPITTWYIINVCFA